MKELQGYEQRALGNTMPRVLRYYGDYRNSFQFERCQNETLIYESKLIVQHVRQETLSRIYTIAQKQINEWEKTQREIFELNHVSSTYANIESRKKLSHTFLITRRKFSMQTLFLFPLCVELIDNY